MNPFPPGVDMTLVNGAAASLIVAALTYIGTLLRNLTKRSKAETEIDLKHKALQAQLETDRAQLQLESERSQRKTLESVTAMMLDANQRSAKLQTQIDADRERHEIELAGLKEELKIARDTIACLQEENNQRGAASAARDKEITELRHRLEETARSFENERQRFAKAITDKDREIERRDLTIGDLNRQLRELRSELVELRAHLERLDKKTDTGPLPEPPADDNPPAASEPAA